MKISSLYLQAFYEIAKSSSFSEAAKNLYVTQSAVSQRLSKLEEELETSLIIRDTSGLILTNEGEELFLYCQSQSSLEDELIHKIQGRSQGLSGTYRVGTYASILRSVVIPSLSKFMKENPRVKIQFFSYGPFDLENALKRAEVDMAIADFSMHNSKIAESRLGNEEFVGIEPKNYDLTEDVYLDHSPRDVATSDFFSFQGMKNHKYQRSFMGDVYGIIDGVKLGLGKAIMSRHLVGESKKIVIKEYKKNYYRPVLAHYYKRVFHTELHNRVLTELELNVKKYLQQ